MRLLVAESRSVHVCGSHKHLLRVVRVVYNSLWGEHCAMHIVGNAAKAETASAIANDVSASYVNKRAGFQPLQHAWFV